MHSIGSFCYSQLILFTHIRFCLYLRCESFYLCLRVFWLFSSEYLQFSRFFLKEFRLFVFYGNLFGCLLRRRRRCSASDTSSTNSRVYVRQLCSEYQEIWLCGGANRIWHNDFYKPPWWFIVGRKNLDQTFFGNFLNLKGCEVGFNQKTARVALLENIFLL